MGKNIITIKPIVKLNVPTEYSPEFFQDKIILYNKHYEKIFGKASKGHEESKKKRIVVIKSKNGKNKIYRQFIGGSSFGIKQSEAYLTFQSLNELDQIDSKNLENNELYILKSNFFFFLWNHPNITNRIAFKFAVYSISISVISILLTIYTLIF